VTKTRPFRRAGRGRVFPAPGEEIAQKVTAGKGKRERFEPETRNAAGGAALPFSNRHVLHITLIHKKYEKTLSRPNHLA
jgi:hypothetical protein